MSQIILLVFLAFVGAGLIGACGPRQFTILTIYDKPAVYVRLEFDQMVKNGSEHSHPVSLTQEQVAAVLGGVRIEEPLAFARGDIVPAFTDKDMVGSSGACNSCLQYSRRCLKPQRLPWTLVQA